MDTQQIFQVFSAFLQQNPQLVQQTGAGSSGLQERATTPEDEAAQSQVPNPASTVPQVLANAEATMSVARTLAWKL